MSGPLLTSKQVSPVLKADWNRPPARMHCFTSDAYFVQLPPGHVFPMEKFPQSAEALVEDGVIASDCVVDPGSVSPEDLLLVHTPDYVASIVHGEFNGRTSAKLGLPPSEALSRRSHAAVAGTTHAARSALT
ncbi:MAG: hypothetical protein AAGK78_04555, partial [Planctomycetota bacterium]